MITIELLALIFASIAVLMSGWDIVDALIDNTNNRRVNLNGSTGMVARIRIRKAMTWFILNVVSVFSSIYVVQARSIIGVAAVALHVAVTRDVTFMVISLISLANSVAERFERRTVRKLVDDEYARGTFKHQRVTDTGEGV